MTEGVESTVAVEHGMPDAYPRAPFPYPGGKAKRVRWLEQFIPEHSAYVEPFGGSASMLHNIDLPGTVVYNDLNGDCVHFFETLRDYTDELLDWLKATPFSRELYERYADAYMDGDRADDPIERAGRFFYLRFTQFGGKLTDKSGFARPSANRRNRARTYRNATEHLRDVARTFDGVCIEHDDYAAVIGRYDSPESFFYCDPPYPGTESYYASEFDHARLYEVLDGVEGRWALSLDTVPDELAEYPRRSLDRGHEIGSGASGSATDSTEYLILSYDPDTTPLFSGSGQATLSEVEL